MPPLEAILERLVTYASRCQPTLRGHLQPGLSPAEVRARLAHAGFPYQPAREVATLYAWHNGTAGHNLLETFFNYHFFLPLEDALRDYTLLQRHDLYLVDRLPLFTFEGEYYVVQCGETEVEEAPVYHDYHSTDYAYDSLTRMLAAELACYETGAYRLEGGKYLRDEAQMAVLKLQWNPGRGPAGLAPYDHP
jgi:hypothetical protein